MDSSSDNGRDSGQRSGGDGNRRNRRGGSGQNRNRNSNRNNSGSGGGGGNRRRNSRSDDDSYRPGGGSGGDSRKKSEPPKKKGLFSKIVGFFTGDDGSATNKGTGRPIQTPRKRPGDSDASRSEGSSDGGGRDNRSSSSRPPREGGDRPQRKRSRRGGGGDRDGGRDGGGGRREGNREGGGGGRGPRRDSGRRDDRSPESESRSGDDRQPRAKREPRIVEVTSGRLYVGNLIYEVTEEDLNDLFKGFGNVVSAEIVTNQRNQQSKGFAFVEMGGVDEAKRAVETLHDKDFMGRKLVVTGAKSDGPVESRSDDADNDAAATPEPSDEQPPASETEAASEQAEETVVEAEQAVSENTDEEKPAE